MRSRRAFLSCGIAGLAAASFLGACTTSTSAPSNYAPFSQIDIVVGTGNVAADGSTVTVNYTGWFYDPAKPDSKGAPFDAGGPSNTPSFGAFVLGQGAVIKGWDQGLVGMRVGGLRRLIIPPSLAYGGTRSGDIPPYSTLVFDVQLLSVTGP